ncbi:SH3 domain-containing protein [Sphingobium sp. SCG-1]|uniref:SH3 domain-containing protein n=1 Tax=Sphingobium sp. SCG-1 TaxID=2072936 RepID=UPI003982DFB7
MGQLLTPTLHSMIEQGCGQWQSGRNMLDQLRTPAMLGWKRGSAIAFPLLALAMLGGTPASAQSRKPLPYWASISEPEARMRVGPNLDYPSNWVYRRRDLPVKVVQVLGNWRKIEDSSGTRGWMHVRLLSDAATAIVKDGVTEMRDRPSDDAKLIYRVQAGVVGRVADCGSGWCAFDVAGKKGYVRASSLWGAVE